MRTGEFCGNQPGHTLTPAPTESYSSILASAENSRQAEAVANGTVSQLNRAQATRQATEKMLRQQGDAFRRGTAAARKSLREAQKRVMGLSVTGINEKVRAGQGGANWLMGGDPHAGDLPPCSVELPSPPLASPQICGVPGDQSCKEAPCGGALCQDGVGTRRCGGTGCAGALPISVRALSSARNASLQLEVALGQLGVVAQKVGVVAPWHFLLSSCTVHDMFVPFLCPFAWTFMPP